MIAQRIITESTVYADRKAVVRDALRLLKPKAIVQRWICEVCGMLHTGEAPAFCDSCGCNHALVQQEDMRHEIGYRW